MKVGSNRCAKAIGMFLSILQIEHPVKEVKFLQKVAIFYSFDSIEAQIREKKKCYLWSRCVIKETGLKMVPKISMGKSTSWWSPNYQKKKVDVKIEQI